MKLKAAESVGIKATHVHLPRSTTQMELLNTLRELNENYHIHGILLQMPLESDHLIDDGLVTNAIDPKKDVDGFHSLNAGELFKKAECVPDLIPCTPKGVMELLKAYSASVFPELSSLPPFPFMHAQPSSLLLSFIYLAGVDPKGKTAVVLGRSNLVGRPMAELLLRADATVTICHSRTLNLPVS